MKRSDPYLVPLLGRRAEASHSLAMKRADAGWFIVSSRRPLMGMRRRRWPLTTQKFIMSINVMARVGSLAGRGAIKCLLSWHQAPLITENVWSLHVIYCWVWAVGASKPILPSAPEGFFFFSEEFIPECVKPYQIACKRYVQVDLFVVTAFPQLRNGMFTL